MFRQRCFWMVRLLTLTGAWLAAMSMTGPHDILSTVKTTAAVLGAYIIGVSVKHLALESDEDEDTNGFWQRLGRWRAARSQQAAAERSLPPPADVTEELIRSIPKQPLEQRCLQMERLGQVGTTDALPMLDELAQARFGHERSRESARRAALAIRLRAPEEHHELAQLKEYPDMPMEERTRLFEHLGEVGAALCLEHLEAIDDVHRLDAVGRIRSRMEVLEARRGGLTTPEARPQGGLSLQEGE